MAFKSLGLDHYGSGTGTLAITDHYGFYAGSHSDGATATLNLTNNYGFYFEDDSTATNTYAFYDASNSLSVFGDIQTQAISITDNTISTNRSNDDLNIKTAGTGRVNVSQDGSDLSQSSQFSTYWGATTNIRDFSVYKSTTDDADTVQRNYMVAFTNESTLTNSSSTNSDYRPRSVLASALVDMAGYSYTRDSLIRGPLAFGAAGNVVNSSATASTIDTVRGLENAAGGYASTAGLIAGDVTIKRAIANYNSIYAANDGTGGAGNYTVDDGYGIYVNAYTGGGSDVISNMYGFYYAGGGNISTEYAFYSANDTAKSRVGSLERYREEINTLTSSSTITVDCSLAPVHTVALGTNTGFVITNLGTGQSVTIIIKSSGTYTATFGTDVSTAVKFPGGAPTITDSGTDVVTIFNDGTDYLGNIAQAYA
jgi:hypothetical protein